MENGFFVKKSRPFLNAGYIMYTISIFYFTFYLFFWGEGRVVRMHPTHPPLPTGLENVL